MRNIKIQLFLSSACIAILLLLPTDAALQLGGNRGGNLNELIAASLLGAVLGTARMKMQRQKEESSQQPKESANHQHKVFRPTPWNSRPLPRNPMMDASHMLPSLHHQQMINPLSVPYYGELTPLLLQLSRDQIYSQMASQLVPTVLANQMIPDIPGLDDISALDTLQSWQSLKNNAGGLPNLLNYGNP